MKVLWYGPCHDDLLGGRKSGWSIMKIAIPFLAGLLFVGTDLLARVALQGVEQAFFFKGDWVLPKEEKEKLRRLDRTDKWASNETLIAAKETVHDVQKENLPCRLRSLGVCRWVTVS
jgi:hypothetical protein